MTWEYWDYHCHLIGYQARKKTQRVTSKATSDPGKHPGSYKPVPLSRNDTAIHVLTGAPIKRNANNHVLEPERVRRKVGIGAQAVLLNQDMPSAAVTVNKLKNEEADNLIEENKKLHLQCLEHEKRGQELNLKITRLRIELEEARGEYSGLLNGSKSLEMVKGESSA